MNKFFILKLLSHRNSIKFVDSAQLVKLSRKNNGSNNYGSVVDLSSTKNLGPPTFTSDTNTSPERYIARIGDRFSVFCEAKGNPNPTISWFKDNKPIDNIIQSKR